MHYLPDVSVLFYEQPGAVSAAGLCQILPAQGAQAGGDHYGCAGGVPQHADPTVGARASASNFMMMLV